ncbi:MAG: hypothetical protein ACXQTG_06440 [Methanoculleaceae archaeon]
MLLLAIDAFIWSFLRSIHRAGMRIDGEDIRELKGRPVRMGAIDSFLEGLSRGENDARWYAARGLVAVGPLIRFIRDEDPIDGRRYAAAAPPDTVEPAIGLIHAAGVLHPARLSRSGRGTDRTAWDRPVRDRDTEAVMWWTIYAGRNSGMGPHNYVNTVPTHLYADLSRNG